MAKTKIMAATATLPETVYRTPDEWGERVYCQSLQAAESLISELRQLGDDWENISTDDFVQLQLRDDGRHEECTVENRDGGRVKTVEIVTLTPEGDCTMTAVATENDQWRL